ncbi:hypothetical protein GUITHDRAFT_100050 [Guillardia theta CCMP2712]|uniref:Uncharacterized protein n=1 Tax=Guillardia theta (strain CCMP2712) TaxID=905079 RepID=L1K297_GUITC|nr:hypothetical protein GUITHDRAFT_100050 [Guillardia theta CCMP2712]EKX54575.1 hypothetical protein GUITHDRAFT_100050 [Guillardia theta CCMP2712]|eukprot:XP_005841555.1 hypothetical protein GUITHDRAFT_100050 [Guillardia theta CCMP2712]
MHMLSTSRQRPFFPSSPALMASCRMRFLWWLADRSANKETAALDGLTASQDVSGDPTCKRIRSRIFRQLKASWHGAGELSCAQLSGGIRYVHAILSGTDFNNRHPLILHFSCHAGNEAIGLFRNIVVSETIMDAVSAHNLQAEKEGAAQAQLVVFNACASNEHKRKLAKIVDFSIGHKGGLEDDKAIEFTEKLPEEEAEEMEEDGEAIQGEEATPVTSSLNEDWLAKMARYLSNMNSHLCSPAGDKSELSDEETVSQSEVSDAGDSEDEQIDYEVIVTGNEGNSDDFNMHMKSFLQEYSTMCSTMCRFLWLKVVSDASIHEDQKLCKHLKTLLTFMFRLSTADQRSEAKLLLSKFGVDVKTGKVNRAQGIDSVRNRFQENDSRGLFPLWKETPQLLKNADS